MGSSHSKTVKVSNEDMKQAIQEGTWRQQSAVKKGSTPNGAGDYGTHQRGRLAEIAFCRYLGVTIPSWTYEEDKKRGCDVIGPDGTRYHIRSSPHKDAGLLIYPRNPNSGIYVHVTTTADGECHIIGWYTKQEAMENYSLTGMRMYPKVMKYEVPQADLHPFYAIGFKNTSLANAA